MSATPTLPMEATCLESKLSLLRSLSAGKHKTIEDGSLSITLCPTPDIPLAIRALASLDLSQNNIPAEEMGPIERLCESKQIALRK